MKKIIKLTAVIALAATLVACTKKKETPKPDPNPQTETPVAEDVKNISILVKDINIKFVVATSDKVEVEQENIDESKKVTVDTANNTLTINQAEEVSNTTSNNDDKSPKIEISLPSKSYEAISVQTASGEIEGDTLVAQTIKLQSDAGEIEFKKLEGVVEITTAAGEIDVDYIKGSLTATSTAGKIDIDGVELDKDSTITNVAGSVELDITKSTGTYNLVANSLTGKVESKHPINKDVEGIKIEISTTNGDIEID